MINKYKKTKKCPYCDSNNIIKYNQYKNKQIYFCKKCGKKYTYYNFKNETYKSNFLNVAISYYNLGNTVNETVKLINKNFNIKVSKSSVYLWINQYSKICNFKKIRKDILKNYKNKPEIIESKIFKHGGKKYNFAFHRPKLEILCTNFIPLLKFILKIKEKCPNDFFNKNHNSSQLKLDIKPRKEGRFNQVCKIANFALEGCLSNDKRHEILKNFMIINDKRTIACEVPVWFWEKYFNLGISGHIDVIQIRRGNIYIMEYKPENSKENDKNLASKLFLYAYGLSFRTKIPLTRFRCAWFNENNYYEFNPNEINFSFKFKNKLYFRKI